MMSIIFDWVEFYPETTEGFHNKYVRDQMFIDDRGGHQEEKRLRDQPPNRQEWGKGRHKEECSPPPPPKGN